MLFLFDANPTLGLGGTGGAEDVPFVLRVGRFVVDDVAG